MAQSRALLGCLAGIVILFAVGFVVTLVFALRGEQSELFRSDRIALLTLDGVIANDADFLRDLKRFRDDRSVRGIVVHVDSPGGAVAPSQSIYQELRKAREEGMPVIASIGSIGASGGYYIALAADSILAMPGSITGSVGVIMQFPNVEDLFERVGVSMDVVKSSDLKDLGSPFRDMSGSERDVLQALVSDVYEQFVEVVVAERGMDEGTVRGLADGRILSGRQALQVGLVDGHGNLPDAIAMAGRMAGLGDDPAIVRPPRPRPSMFELLVSRAAGSVFDGIGARVSEPFRGPQLRYIAH